LVAFDAKNGDGDIVANHQGFTDAARENQHALLPFV
jgi:hypothetical protein